NVLFMLQSGLGFYFYPLAFLNSDLAHINDFQIFQFAFIEAFPLYNVLFYSVFAIILLDAIYLMFLGGVKEKALHDRWAKTAVVVDN
ncbi:hypothetical protein RZS08_35255, partial [Arthrospira platensis SPKY1]|nr:hypothetical protein [Arthrospira platensis SPKY1]